MGAAEEQQQQQQQKIDPGMYQMQSANFRHVCAHQKLDGPRQRRWRCIGAAANTGATASFGEITRSVTGERVRPSGVRDRVDGGGRRRSRGRTAEGDRVGVLGTGEGWDWAVASGPFVASCEMGLRREAGDVGASVRVTSAPTQ